MKTLACKNLQINKKEALKYLGVRGEVTPELSLLLDECIALVGQYMAPKAVFEVYDVKILGEFLNLGFAKVKSKDLLKNLQGCNKIALFAATVGAEVDRLILKYSKISPSKATVLQAIGSAAVENWCDLVNDEIIRDFGACKPRFSCGYGDLNISLQRDIFAALSLEKHLGLTLLENFFMTPTKSVTAIVGIKNDDTD